MVNYYAQIENNKLIARSNCKSIKFGVLNLKITKEIYDNFEKYIYQNDEIVENPEYERIALEQAKQEKIEQNDNIRDEALNKGVLYKNVLFDSDTDQKVNLLATYNSLSDEDSIVWFGKDNNGLECYKSDLLAIGELITQLHMNCWTKNAEIKTQIAQAQSLEELNNISFDYSFIQ